MEKGLILNSVIEGNEISVIVWVVSRNTKIAVDDNDVQKNLSDLVV